MKFNKCAVFTVILLVIFALISVYFLKRIEAGEEKDKKQDLIIRSNQKQIPSLVRFITLVKELNEASKGKLTTLEVVEVAKVIINYCVLYDNIGLTPSLVMGIMERESGFNPKAVSKARARGLMQVIQFTFEFHLRELNYGQYSHDLAFNPIINVEVGIRHLIYLRKYWLAEGKEDWVYAIMSYFWGTKNVWQLIETKGRAELPSLEYGTGVLELAEKWKKRGVL